MSLPRAPRGERFNDAFDGLVERRYLVLAIAATVIWLLRLFDTDAAGGDWRTFHRAVLSLRSVGATGLYIGPAIVLLALATAWLSTMMSWIITSALCMAAGVASIRWIEQASAIAGFGTQRDRERAALVGGLFLLYVWSQPGVVNGHADDVMALTSIAFAVRAVSSGRWLAASLAMALAVDSKAWAALALPMAIACAGNRWRGAAVAVGAAVLPLLPFVFLHHGSLDTSSLNLHVESDSDLHFLGVAAGTKPGWTRELQLAVALPLCTYAIAKRRWYVVPLVAFAVRVNLDPATYQYYLAGPVFGLFIWEVVRPRRTAGLWTAVACLGLFVLPTDLLQLDVRSVTVTHLTDLMRLAMFIVALAALAPRRTAPVE